MIPLHDDNPRVMIPWVNFSLITVNVLVFLHEFRLEGDALNEFIRAYGAIPQHLVAGQTFLPLLTSMFLHGGIVHLLSNMLYLYIFGDNIEGLMGHGRYLIFYLLCGVGAAASHIFIDPMSQTPMVGASGAISGVLGAYLLKFPRARVLILFWIFILTTVRVPALVVLGLWFVMQLTNGLATLGLQTTGGVAWFAHIGGFIVGFLLVNMFQKRRPRQWEEDRW